ncbi:hypothetical protein ABT56_18345 [Photobacterium aquae]|uniref:Uncharacterized protein n=1 Tax=Photobacterium aquae TaxID=1195763 RepID=A0A0J1GW54_9GAMM|nr:hypothetical protein [Photobacterium aquae]KLV03659.1 hypothetical protein ABT56_18345 [Photobacterium aquae]
MIVNLPCADGSDRNCREYLEAKQYPWQWCYLDSYQKSEVIDSIENITENEDEHIVELTLPANEACEILSHDNNYTQKDIDEIRMNNATYTIYLEFHARTCGACGSDQ